jgi:hypothetical protein
VEGHNIEEDMDQKGEKMVNLILKGIKLEGQNMMGQNMKGKKVAEHKDG